MSGRVLALAVILVACGGCKFLGPQPKVRVGSAPYPRANSYLDALDPADLGPHRYDSWLPYLDAEKSRGIVYSCRGGFVDLSHARHVTDWSRHLARRVRDRLADGRDAFNLAGTDHSTLEFRVNYPDWWSDLPTGERDDLTNALAVRVGQMAANALQVYHEAQTWYGYRYVPIFSEWDSAFCYDDMVSHLLGARVAAVALGDGEQLDVSEQTYNRRVEAAYAEAMRDVDAVPPKATWQAIAAAGEAGWYGEDVPVKRQVDTGFGDGRLEPWLLPEYDCQQPDHDHAGRPVPLAFELPHLRDVRGRDLTHMVEIVVRPGIVQRRRTVAALGGAGRRLSLDGTLPLLVEVVRSDAAERLGRDAVSPPPDQPPPTHLLPADGGPAVELPGETGAG